MMSEENEKVDDSAESIPIKINFRIPQRMPSVYAHHLIVQQGPHEVLISFFEVMPPAIIGEADEAEIKQLQEKGVTAECVARVIVARHRYPEFVKALAGVLDPPEKEEEQGHDKAS